MLDLSAAFNKYYEIKLEDSSILELKRPTQAIQQTLIDVLPLLQKNEENAKALEIIANLFCRILNRNKNNRLFTESELADVYDFAVMSYVIQDYFIFWNKEIQENVNFRNSQQ